MTMTTGPAATIAVHLDGASFDAELRREARAGLTAKRRWLAPTWLYDRARVCALRGHHELPEYYPTRTERGILAQRAGDIARLSGADTLVELGSGTSEKTHLLLDALAATGQLHRFVPFDVAEPTLRVAAETIAATYPGLEVTGVVGDFRRHLPAIPTAGRRLFAFLGGTIGNFPPAERHSFLTALAATMRPGDSLLLGTDLVKDPARLVAAYDDAAGVTAAFDRNVLHVLNDRLGADFDPDRFEHVAALGRRQRVDRDAPARPGEHVVNVPALDLTLRFADGEELRTEISAKFRRRAGAPRAAGCRAPAAPLVDRSGRRLRRVSGAAMSAPSESSSGRTMRPAYCDVRALTEQLAAPLSAEDQTVQSMPDTSPTKWHRAHTTWFFETFVLGRRPRAVRPVLRVPVQLVLRGRRTAPRPPRARSDHATRRRRGHRLPRARRCRDADAARRRAVAADVRAARARPPPRAAAPGADRDGHPARPVAQPVATGVRGTAVERPRRRPPPHGWIDHPGGVVAVGHDGRGFAYDNERPRHDVLLRPFRVARSLVTCGEWQAFIDDGGYLRPELWMSDGWHTVQAFGWEAPEYWSRDGRRLAPLRPCRRGHPSTRPLRCSTSAGTRPTPSPAGATRGSPPRRSGRPWPRPPWTATPTGGTATAWQWTASPYTAYPGFRPAPGAVGEYNGKFMVNQQVLRGGSLATPPGHTRRTYRNFFPPAARWMFAGVRLASD